jgi:hypothetical protein
LLASAQKLACLEDFLLSIQAQRPDAQREDHSLSGFAEAPEEALVFDMHVRIPEGLRNAQVWEIEFAESEGWMCFNINDFSLAVLGDGRDHLGDLPLSGWEASVHLVSGDNLSALNQLRDNKEVRISEMENVTDDVFGELGLLERVEHLSLNRPARVTSLAPLRELKMLTRLKVRDARSLVDLPALAALQNLEELNLIGCDALSDLGPLASAVGLKHLRIEHSLKLDAIEPLRPLTGLIDLSLTGCGACDLAPLASMTEMQSLSLCGCEGVEDLSPLRGMTKLRHLFLSDCPKVHDLTPLAHMTDLCSLCLNDCWRVPVPLREAVEARDFELLRTLLSAQSQPPTIE